MDHPNQEIDLSAPSARGVCFVDEIRLVALLLVLALGLRVWHYSTTEVASRDSIYYIRMAWDFANGRGIEAVRGAEQHPGYPLLVCAVDGIVGPLFSGGLAERYQR